MGLPRKNWDCASVYIALPICSSFTRHQFGQDLSQSLNPPQKKIYHLKIFTFAAPFKRPRIACLIITQRVLQKTGFDIFRNLF